jgi:hypothetical protein
LCDATEGRGIEAKANLREALEIHRKIGSPNVGRVAGILQDRGW